MVSFSLLLSAIALSWSSVRMAQASPDLVPRAVVKLIIEYPRLAKYLHPELEGRVPLVISDHLLAPGITPSRFGHPVQIIPDRDIGARPHIRFMSFKVKGTRATTVIEYKAEGVRGEFELESTPSGWWKVLDAKISES